MNKPRKELKPDYIYTNSTNQMQLYLELTPVFILLNSAFYSLHFVGILMFRPNSPTLGRVRIVGVGASGTSSTVSPDLEDLGEMKSTLGLVKRTEEKPPRITKKKLIVGDNFAVDLDCKRYWFVANSTFELNLTFWCKSGLVDVANFVDGSPSKGQTWMPHVDQWYRRPELSWQLTWVTPYGKS